MGCPSSPVWMSEPILGWDALLLVQIIAACCGPTSIQGKQTSVCYLCCAANGMMVLLGVIAMAEGTCWTANDQKAISAAQKTG